MDPPSPDLSLFNSTSKLLSLLDLNDHNSMQSMENMDIDLVTVLDTPDRLSTQNINKGGNIAEDIQTSSVAGSSRISNLLDKGVHRRVMDRGRLNIENANNRRLFSHSRRDIGIRGGEAHQNGHTVVNLDGPSSLANNKRLFSGSRRDIDFHGETHQNSHPVVDLDSPSASKNARLHKRMMFENFSSLPQLHGHVAFSNVRAKLDGDTSSIAELLLAEDGKAQGKKEKRKALVSSSEMPPNTSTTLHRKNGQRRLVRNGCISPQNIAKATCTGESHKKCYEVVKPDDVENVVSPSQMHIVRPISGGNDTGRVKGKGVMEDCSPQKFNNESLHLSSRSSLNPTEEATIVEDVNRDTGFGETGGWRSTRRRSNNTSLTLSDGVRHLSRTNDEVGHSHEISNPASLQRGPTPFLTQASSGFRSEMPRQSGRHCGTSNVARRQRKRGSTGGNSGECSTSVFVDSEIDFLWSTEGNSNARATRSQSNRHRGNLHPVIEINDMSPVVQCGGSENATQMVNDDSDARARQLEADEMMARELQEQYYHELPRVGGGEFSLQVDANIALSLQHEEEELHASSLRRQRVHPRDASMSHLYRQHQTQALQNSLTRSAILANRGRARAPSSARGTRLRDRLRGNSAAISSRETSIQFHPNINVEMRMHILEALEAAVGTTENMMPSSFFQLQRDFNENDYEMLLALDEDNHQHVGTNPAVINGLPQSTVQTENFAEDCAICLETPTLGDTIRHLPCLHKFHKDCIDPWLRRKKSCPICKSGIT